jgi:hypothetical protein
MDLDAVLHKVPRGVRGGRSERWLNLFELGERGSDYGKTFSGGMKRRSRLFRWVLSCSRRSGSSECEKPQRRFEDSDICPIVRYSAWK